MLGKGWLKIGKYISSVYSQAGTCLLLQLKLYFVYAFHSIKKFVSTICVPYGNNESLSKINGKLVLGKVANENRVKNSCCFFSKMSYIFDREIS